MTADDHPNNATPGASTADHDPIPHYEIRVEGRLGSGWAAWFDGLSLTDDADGTTVIHGPLLDQAALHGVIARLRDVGIPLISLSQIASNAPTQTHERQ